MGCESHVCGHIGSKNSVVLWYTLAELAAPHGTITIPVHKNWPLNGVGLCNSQLHQKLFCSNHVFLLLTPMQILEGPANSYGQLPKLWGPTGMSAQVVNKGNWSIIYSDNLIALFAYEHPRVYIYHTPWHPMMQLSYLYTKGLCFQSFIFTHGLHGVHCEFQHGGIEVHLHLQLHALVNIHAVPVS